VTFLVVALMSIPAAEGVFRLIGDRPSGDLGGLFKPFGNGGYKLAPSVDTEATWAAGLFSVHTDSLGLRCDAARRLAIKSGDRLDALFLGDSQGFGHGVSFEESLAGGVAELALQNGMHFANASVGGHAIGNQLELAHWLHDQHGAHVSNYILLVTPLMVEGVGGYTRASVGGDGRLYEDSNNGWAHLRVWLKTHCVIYDRVRDAAQNAGLFGDLKDDVPSVLRLYGAGESEKSLEAKWVSFLNELAAFAKQQGAGLRIVYVPLTIETDFELIRRNARKARTEADPDLPVRIVSAAAGQVGIPFHDIRPVLQQLRIEGEPLHLKGDFHYDRKLSHACAQDIWNDLKIQLAAPDLSGNKSASKETYGK